MCVLKSGFFNTLTWGAIALQSLHLPLQPKPFPNPCQKSFEQRKEMTFNRVLSNTTGTVYIALPLKI